MRRGDVGRIAEAALKEDGTEAERLCKWEGQGEEDMEAECKA